MCIPKHCVSMRLPVASFTRTFRIAGVAMVLSVFSGLTMACEGEDYERTLAVVQYAQNLGMQCGMSANPIECIYQAMPALASEVNQLSPSCQRLLESMGGPAPSPGGTTCIGGVCCDSSSCYGP